MILKTFLQLTAINIKLSDGFVVLWGSRNFIEFSRRWNFCKEEAVSPLLKYEQVADRLVVQLVR
jgi:hypothetical protein